MERRSRVFKRCVCVFAVLLALAGNRVYADTQRFRIDVVCGYNAVAKEYESIPVTLEVENAGDAFEGSVDLHVSDSLAYACDLAIGAGETKSVSFYLSDVSNYSQIHITINDAGGKTVYSQDSTVSVASYPAPFVGILSDDYGALSYFSNLLVRDQAHSMRYPTTVNLTKNLHCTDYRSLDMFDIIVLNDFNTGSLTQSQSELLKTWVERGGSLLVGTGVQYQRTISGFLGDDLSGTMGLIERRTGYLGAQDAYNIGESDSLSLDILNIRLENGAAFDDQWYQLARKGLGNIAVFQFDLAGRDLLNWEYRDRSVQSIVNNILQSKTGRQDANQFDDSSVDEIISNVYINDIPDIGHYIAVLAVYVLLFPVIYLILKRKDKRHFIWITVPVLSVLFGVAVYVTGSGSRLKNPNLNYLCVLALNEYNTQETVYMGSTSPRNRAYQFSIDSEYSLSAMYTYNYYGYNSRMNSGYDDAKIRIRKNVATPHEVSVRYSSAFETNYFRAEKYNASIGDIRVQLEYLKDGCRLAVANDTGLEIEDAGIVIPDYGIVKIGRLGVGETAEFDERQVLFGYQWEPADVILPVDSAMEKSRIGRNKQISAYCRLVDWQYDPYFIGFSQDYIPGIGSNSHIDTAGDTMLVKAVQVVSGGNAAHVSNILRHLVEVDESYGYWPDYIYESEPLYATYRFDDIIVDFLRIQGMEDLVTVSFLNPETGEFDPMFSDDEFVASDRLEPYLDDEQCLQIKYETDPSSDEYMVQLPTIIAFGVPVANEADIDPA